MAYETNHLSGYEKDKIRKEVGHNRLTGSEMDKGRTTKTKALENKKSGFDGNKRWDNSSPRGYGVNSPAMMEARAAFNKKKGRKDTKTEA